MAVAGWEIGDSVQALTSRAGPLAYGQWGRLTDLDSAVDAVEPTGPSGTVTTVTSARPGGGV